jgi:recombination protein RecR
MTEPWSPNLRQLVEAFKCLPGVGQKSAQRMVFHLLQRNREGARTLADSLALAVETIGSCETCRMLTEDPQCGFCTSARRDDAVLCVIESPADLLAIEQSGIYDGRYFVLMGHLSPIDGIGPAELGLDLLGQRLAEGQVRELVLATSVTVEGDATAHLLAQMARRHGVRASRIAYGVPVGSELEFIDSGTLSRAFSGRLWLAAEEDSQVQDNG